MSRGSSRNYSVSGRALLRPEEILTLSNDCVIVLLRGMDPILAERVKWYQDREFNPAAPRRRRKPSQHRGAADACGALVRDSVGAVNSVSP